MLAVFGLLLFGALIGVSPSRFRKPMRNGCESVHKTMRYRRFRRLRAL